MTRKRTHHCPAVAAFSVGATAFLNSQRRSWSSASFRYAENEFADGDFNELPRTLTLGSRPALSAAAGTNSPT